MVYKIRIIEWENHWKFNKILKRIKTTIILKMNLINTIFKKLDLLS